MHADEIDLAAWEKIDDKATALSLTQWHVGRVNVCGERQITRTPFAARVYTIIWIVQNVLTPASRSERKGRSLSLSTPLTQPIELRILLFAPCDERALNLNYSLSRVQRGMNIWPLCDRPIKCARCAAWFGSAFAWLGGISYPAALVTFGAGASIRIWRPHSASAVCRHDILILFALIVCSQDMQDTN